MSSVRSTRKFGIFSFVIASLLALGLVGCQNLDSPEAVVKGVNVAIEKNNVKIWRATLGGDLRESLGNQAGLTDLRTKIRDGKLALTNVQTANASDDVMRFQTTANYDAELVATYGDAVVPFAKSTFQCITRYDFTPCSTFTERDLCIYDPATQLYRCRLFNLNNTTSSEAWCSEGSLSQRPRRGATSCALTSLN